MLPILTYSTMLVKTKKININILIAKGGLEPLQPPPWLRLWVNHTINATLPERLQQFLANFNLCKRPAEQCLHWERKEKRIPGQSITSSIVKSLSAASFGFNGLGRSKTYYDKSLEVVTKAINLLNFCTGSLHVPGYSVDYFKAAELSYKWYSSGSGALLFMNMAPSLELSVFMSVAPASVRFHTLIF